MDSTRVDRGAVGLGSAVADLYPGSIVVFDEPEDFTFVVGRGFENGRPVLADGFMTGEIPSRVIWCFASVVRCDTLE